MVRDTSADPPSRSAKEHSVEALATDTMIFLAAARRVAQSSAEVWRLRQELEENRALAARLSELIAECDATLAADSP